MVTVTIGASLHQVRAIERARRGQIDGLAGWPDSLRGVSFFPEDADADDRKRSACAERMKSPASTPRPPE